MTLLARTPPPCGSEFSNTVDASPTLGPRRLHRPFREDGPLAIFTAPLLAASKHDDALFDFSPLGCRRACGHSARPGPRSASRLHLRILPSRARLGAALSRHSVACPYAKRDATPFPATAPR